MRYLFVTLLFVLMPTLGLADGLSGRYSGRVCISKFSSNSLNQNQVDRCQSIRWTINDYRSYLKIRTTNGIRITLRRRSTNVYVGASRIIYASSEGVTCGTRAIYGVKRSRSYATIATSTPVYCDNGQYVEVTREGRWRL